MNYLITPSLLNSWQWFLSVEDDDKQEAERQKFIATLKREKFEKTPAMEFGIKFEDDIAFMCRTKTKTINDTANEIVNIVSGGTWQLPCKKLYKNFLLYGRMDVVKGNVVYDIKTASRYDVGKFQKSAQHRLYLYCTGLERCDYLVAEVYHGKEETIIKGFCVESYTDRDIEPMVDDFIAWLDYDPELKLLYYAHWESKY